MGYIRTVPASAEERLRRILRATLSERLFRLCSAGISVAALMRSIGVRSYVRLIKDVGCRTSSAETKHIELRPRELAYPFEIRLRTTDLNSFVNAISRQMYAASLPSEPVNLIVDAG